MTSTHKHARDLVYVYGIVPATFDLTGAPAGLDDAPVSLVKRGDTAALTSHVASETYAAETIEQRSGDVSWLSPRAQAHDRVLTWAQERDVVLPLPIFSMWGSDESVAKSLETQRKRIASLLQRVSGADEFGLRVHRRDQELLASIDTLDADAARLRAEAQAASPGQRYLLERKLAEHSKGAVRAAAQRMAREIFEQLRALSRDAIARPLTPDRARVDEASMVLNGAFLVERRKLDAFRAAVAAAMRDYGARGLAFDFTGPWPPYNFVAEDGSPAMEGEGGGSGKRDGARGKRG
jgi:Gas vesicle synthesis protein GvpL/GvpF